MGDTGFSSTTTKVSATDVEYGAVPSERQLEITKGNTKVSISSAPTPSSDEITINYNLENDESDISSIKVEYSTDGIGGTYSACTEKSGGTGLLNKTTDGDGVAGVFIWESGTDLGANWKGDIHIRITAYDHDNHKGSKMFSEEYKHNIDNTPSAPVIVNPAAGYFRKPQTPEFQFTIPNPNAINSKLHFKVEFDIQNSFDTADLITFESRNDQDGWSYHDGTDWQPIPAAGVDIPGDPTLIGNNIRFKVQTHNKLTRRIYYWRPVAAGVI